MPLSIRQTDAERPIAGPLRVAIVVARYNQWITDALVKGALGALEKRASDAGADVIAVPGSFEVVAAAAAAARSGKFHAIVALGCIIKGETSHDQHLARAVTSALGELSAECGAVGIGVGLGVLTVDSAEQAEARAGGVHGNKGAEAMQAALEMVVVLRQVLG
jgi:6,7-dimethyl-8-ribityllumazine synthase